MADHYNIEMIGRLATDAEVPFRNAVIINNSNEIQYNIRTLSTQNGVKEEIFTGYINSIRNIGPFDFEDDESESDENRIAAFLKYCSDKLFVFTHKKLVKAADKDNWDKLFLICLDEMNLARVEHYFSQFLSILEKPVGSRKLVLYDDQYEGKLYNSDKYPHSIFIRDNVKFVGTVNIDESTYHFSDKVLDRANVITLDILDYSNPDNWKPVKYMGTNTPEWTNEDFSKLIKKDDVQFEHQARIRELLWQMHLILHRINSNLGVGPRIVKSIEAYLRNLPEISNEYALSIREGLDYQITQRILTKIRGPREQLESLFIKDSKTQNVLIALLDSFSDVSSFNRSRTIIEQKENELKTYGYCL